METNKKVRHKFTDILDHKILFYTALKEMFHQNKYFAQVKASMKTISITNLKLITD